MKTTGHIEKISIDITKPLPMKAFELDLNSVNLLVGANGTGKTFILVLTWLFSSIMQAAVGIFINKWPAFNRCINEFAEKVVKKSIEDSEITGTVKCTYESGAWLEIVFENGQVQKLSVDNFQDIEQPTNVCFMSTNIRTFDSIQQYLKIRKKLSDAGKDIEQICEEMSNIYKLYDVIYIERLLANMPLLIPQDLIENLKNFIKDFNVSSIEYDEDKCNFIAKTTEGNRYLTSYSKGEQSMINMIIGTYIHS